MNPSTLLWWSTKLQGERSTRKATESTRRPKRGAAEQFEHSSFVQVSAAIVDDRFELELGGGRRLPIPPGFDSAALGRLLVVLK